jgi:hypothetical protein
MMSNLHEAPGQDVKEEAPEELVRREGDGALAASTERDAALVEGDEATVGESHTMRVPAEIAEDLLGSAEGLLGVDDAAGAIELVAQARESRGRANRAGLARAEGGPASRSSPLS